MSRRAGILFLGLLLGQVILVSAQVNSRSGSNVLQTVTVGAFGEAQRLTMAMAGGLAGVWSRYVGLRGLHQENQALQARVAALEFEMQRQRILARQGERLRGLLALRDRIPRQTLAANVIAGDATPWFHTVVLDVGRASGVRGDQPVLAPQGVVGRIIGEPSVRSAKVQLLIDPNAAAGGLVERSRAGGVVLGAGAEQPLRLAYVSNLADVRVGDTVVTSGIDGVYPKGFAIGQVASVERGPSLYLDVTVTPAVEFTSLEEVLVVVEERPPMPAEVDGR